MAREHDHAVEPQIGDLAHEVQAIAPLAASTTSVASSPIFFSIASSPPEELGDIGLRRVAALALVDRRGNAFERLQLSGFHRLSYI